MERLTRYLVPGEADILTIGFARRFATYKRATLLFSDPPRLKRLLNNPEQPVLLLFAGNATRTMCPPTDTQDTRILTGPRLHRQDILLEGYDMALARKLVTGVDVWLNTPEYPLEASGTSGQKAQ